MGSDGGDRLRPYVPRVVLRQLAVGDGSLSQTVEGTVVFVDISGFTKLSERLARRGREGAEHLADSIGGCFSTLLALAYANGGSLLKFGGDALLLLFEGDGHVERAVRSAAGMRRALREVGRIEAGGARVVLRMSVGVHTDEFHLFLVGGSHREFLITGPAATRVVEMEGAAGSGEIVLSPEVCRRLAPGCVGARKGPGRLLLRAPAGASLPPEEQTWTVDESLVATCLSTGLRSHVLAGVQAPEHRTVTVAFVHFDGTDELIERDGLDLTAAALEQLVRTVQNAADDHGVCFLSSDVDADGGKLILTAGAPRVLGEDEERMLLAMRRVVEAPLALPVRIGINRGPVFAGDVGPHYRRTYTVMGDAVNLAARLMAKAPTGEIYASADLLGRSRTRFEAERLEPFMVKGKARPVEACSVGPAISGGTGDAVGHQVPLVGRDGELATLEGALESAIAGSGRLVEIAGEGGLGKTRLAEELRRRAGDVRVLRADCEAYTASTPYAAWRRLLRQLIDIGADDPDSVVLRRLHAHVTRDDAELRPWLPLLAIAFDVEVPTTQEVERLAPEFRVQMLHWAVLRFLRPRMAVPTLVVVEDGHLMDAASADLLAAVAEQLGDSSWLFLVTRRDAEGGFAAADAPYVLRIEPEPLGAADAAHLAERLTESAPLAPDLVRLVAERSGGNPQFLRDLLRAVADGADELPDTVEAAAMARIDRLAAADKALVRRASVLGVTFPARLLDEVLGEDVPPPDDATWQRIAGLIVRDDEGQVRFRRAVIREAAYGGLPFKVRRLLHARAGHRLERDLGDAVDDAAGILSLHFLLAGDHGRAWRYARSAADRARESYAHRDAAQLYRRALDAARALGVPRAETAGLWKSLGDALSDAGEARAAMDAYTEARRRTDGDPVRQAGLLDCHAAVAIATGDTHAAVRWAQRGLRTLEGCPGEPAARFRARLLSRLGFVRQRQKRFDDTIDLCRRAIAEAEATRDEETVAHACFILDWALFESGRGEEAGHSERALEIYERLGKRDGMGKVLNNMGMFAYWEGRWDEAVTLYRRSTEALTQAGNFGQAAFGHCNVGEVRSDQGRLDEAEAELKRALQTWRGTGGGDGAAWATALLGRAAARAGRREEAQRLLYDALAQFEAIRLDADVVFTQALIAESLAFTCQSDEALAAAERLLGHGADVGRLTPLLHRVRGCALAQQGLLDAAEVALEASLAEARRWSDDFEAALTLDVLAELSRLRRGDDLVWRRARDPLIDKLDVVVLPRPPAVHGEAPRPARVAEAGS